MDSSKPPRRFAVINFLPLFLFVMLVILTSLDMWPSRALHRGIGTLNIGLFFGVSVYMILRKNLHKALIALVFFPCTTVIMYFILLFLKPKEKQNDVLWPKALISVGVAFGAIIILIIADLLWFSAKNVAFEKSETEGNAFGRKSDQQGCIDEGLSRLKGVHLTLSNIDRLVDGGAFVDECLKVSRPTPGFCDGAPSWWKFQEDEYEAQQCEMIGLESGRDGCETVFEEKYEFCTGW